MTVFPSDHTLWRNPAPDDPAAEACGLVAVRQVLDQAGLDGRERLIAERRLDGWHMSDIGVELGVTEARVSQLTAGVKRKVARVVRHLTAT